MQLFEDGGPTCWTCNALIAWALAFPGAMNLDFDRADPQCPEVPRWHLANVQPHAKQLLDLDVWGESVHVRCFHGRARLGEDYTRLVDEPARDLSFQDSDAPRMPRSAEAGVRRHSVG